MELERSSERRRRRRFHGRRRGSFRSRKKAVSAQAGTFFTGSRCNFISILDLQAAVLPSPKYCGGVMGKNTYQNTYHNMTCGWMPKGLESPSSKWTLKKSVDFRRNPNVRKIREHGRTINERRQRRRIQRPLLFIVQYNKCCFDRT